MTIIVIFRYDICIYINLFVGLKLEALKLMQSLGDDHLGQSNMGM